MKDPLMILMVVLVQQRQNLILNLLRQIRNFSTICVPNKTEYLHLNGFNVTTGINLKKPLENIFHVIINVNLMVKNVIQFKSGIKISVNASAKIQ